MQAHADSHAPSLPSPPSPIHGTCLTPTSHAGPPPLPPHSPTTVGLVIHIKQLLFTTSFFSPPPPALLCVPLNHFFTFYF